MLSFTFSSFFSIIIMALFVPVIIGLPIGYFTWAKVFDIVDDCVSQALSGNNNTTGNS